MANSTLSPTLDPFSTKPTEKFTPIGGGVGFFETDYQETNEGPVRLPSSEIAKFPSVGSISFGKVTENMGMALGDTVDAGLDLFHNYLLGADAGKDAAVSQIKQSIYGEGNPEITQAQAEAIEQEEDAQKISKIENWFKEISDSQSAEQYKQEADESIKATGRIVTEEDGRKVGSTKEHIFKRYVLGLIAEEDAKVEGVIEEQENNTPIPGASALNAATEGGSGSLNPELSGASPKANISAIGGSG